MYEMMRMRLRQIRCRTWLSRCMLLLAMCSVIFVLFKAGLIEYFSAVDRKSSSATRQISRQLCTKVPISEMTDEMRRYCMKFNTSGRMFSDVTEVQNSSNDSYLEYVDSDTFALLERNVSQFWREYDRRALAAFILSTIGLNSTSVEGFKREIRLIGWEGHKHRTTPIKCCFLWRNTMTTQFANPQRAYWKLGLSLVATEYTCPIKGSYLDLRGVALNFKRAPCSTAADEYRIPDVAQKQEVGSFAICVKIVFGDIDAKSLVHWIEYHREMKVQRIYMHTFNLSSEVQMVINRYTTEGYIEARPFNYPWQTGRLTREVGWKNPVVWQDEQVVVFDCVHRLSGYTYIAIIDIDEFIRPMHHPDIPSLMRNLTAKYPKAAGFTFKSHLYVKDWGSSGNPDGAVNEKYLKRTPAVYTRQKNIMIADRVIESSVNTHEFLPMSGYERVYLTERLAVLNHYRTCYWDYRKLCGNKTKRYVDTYMLHALKRYRNRTLWIDEIL